MRKLLFMLLFYLVPMSYQVSVSRYAQCPVPHIEHGRVRRRQSARLARFSCNPHFELVGNKYATCRLGVWDVPIPVCVRAGCEEPSIENGMTIPSRRGAWMMFFCFPGYRLVGSPALYCDGYNWNATAPSCVPENASEQLSCDFETPDLCGWRHDELHDFDWKRLNMKTPSSFLFTGPSFDHTIGKGGSGYYMYIESTSKLENDTARLISPVFNGSLTKKGCFSFFYHMYGKTIGGLRVYQIPENFHQQHVNLTWSEKQDYLLFEKWGNQGDFWFRNVSKLNDTAGNFQIVIEGIRGTSFTSDIAIDDVAILEGDQCNAAVATAVTPPEVLSETCAGRCDFSGRPVKELGCGCTALCVTDDNCCPDFFEICVFNSASVDDGDYSNSTDKRTSDQPLTEKLIGTTSTPAPTSTTTFPPSTVRTTRVITTTTTRAPPITPKTTTTSKFTTSTTPKTPSTTIRTTTHSTVTSTRAKPSTTTAVPTKPPRTTTISTSTSRPTTTPRLTTTTTPKSNNVQPTAVPPNNKTQTQHIIMFTTTSRAVRKTTAWVQSDAAKAKKEQSIEAAKAVKEKPTSSPGSTAAVITMLFLSSCFVAAALVMLRSARGRAALARLRGRASSDPEVRYLTQDHD